MQTTDNRVFTTTVTPQTGTVWPTATRLTLTVAGRGCEVVGGQQAERGA